MTERSSPPYEGTSEKSSVLDELMRILLGVQYGSEDLELALCILHEQSSAFGKESGLLEFLTNESKKRVLDLVERLAKLPADWLTELRIYLAMLRDG